MPAPASGSESQTSIPPRRPRPGVFLMIDSLQTGGSERQFRELARALDPNLFALTLGCIQKTGAFLDGLQELEEFRLGGSLYGVQSWRTRLRLARRLRRSHFAIAHGFDLYANLTLVPAAKLARVPVVIGSQRQLGDLLTPMQFRAQLAAFHLCDRVICNSRAAATRLIEEGLPSRKVIVIGNGLPDEAFAEVQPAMPRTGRKVRVGMVARMNARYKNHALLLRAAARLRARFPDLELLFAGDGPLRPELERRADELGLRDAVQFLGDRRDIRAVLASLDISVVPSASESLSNVVLESMAAGIPVVATDVGGNRELLADGRGLLVPPDDEAALAAAIEHVRNEPGLGCVLAQNARSFAEQNFTMDLMRRRHEELYAELLEEKHWRPRRDPSSKLRVVMVGPSLSFVGGQSVQADLLLRKWEHDREVDAQFLAVDPTFPRGLRWTGRIPFLRTVIREPLYLAELWQGLKGADVAHIYSASYWSFLLAPAPALLMARLRGVKTLLNYHSGEARDHLRRFRSARPLLQQADRLIVPSDYLVEVFREFGLRAQPIANIVDFTQFSFRRRDPLRPHLLCSRGFHRYYAVDVVVRAFAEVLREFPDARLDLAGKGREEGQIRDLVERLNLRQHVCFLGVTPNLEMGRTYDRADIFINASNLDNMPLSILEAFASGTPVVTTAPEGIRYLVEHQRTGLMSEPGDAVALARNVICLLRNPALARQLAENAHAECRRYEWAAVRPQWLKAYRDLAGA